MRTQWCRDHIDQIKENCGDLAEKTVYENKRAAAFCVDHPAFSDCPTKVVFAVLSIKDSNIKKGVISEAESILKRRMPKGGFFKKKFTLKEIRTLIAKYQLIFPPKTPKPNAKSTTNKKPTKVQKSEKARLLTVDILEKEERTILKSMVALEYGEDEYEVLKVAIKWAADKIADGMKHTVG